MTTMRERFIGHLAKLREWNDSRLGLRRFTLYVRRRVPIGGIGGVGAEWHVSDEIVDERPRVSRASARDVAESAGRILAGDFILSRITPRNEADTAGVWLEAINQKSGGGREQVTWVLDGPGFPPYRDEEPPSGGGEFTLVHLDVTGNFSWKAVLRPVTGRTGTHG